MERTTIGRSEWGFEIENQHDAPAHFSFSSSDDSTTNDEVNTNSEVHNPIEPPTITTTSAFDNLKSRNHLHPSVRPIFGFEWFNKMQSECFNSLYETDENVVISAPTAAGKTVCFDLAIARLIRASTNGNRQKILYLAPLKSLIQERHKDWELKLKRVGWRCQELSSDSQNSSLGDDVDLFLSTPEKWDSISRRWKENNANLKSIGLVLVDEIHTIGGKRGSVLESILIRMKLFASKQLPRQSLRIIALSATAPNIADIGRWIEAPSGSIFKFGDEHKPITPDLVVLGYSKQKNEYLFDKMLDGKLFDVITQHNSGKPCLVFCSSRKSCVTSASKLLESCVASSTSFVKSNEQRERLFEAVKKVQAGDAQLAACLLSGIAFHHAGMTHEHRTIVEKLFCSGSDIMVVFSTSTLAVGVNLPAYLVVIKSTTSWTPQAGTQEVSPTMIKQMIGRAGRPQFGDQSAKAVIMTQIEKQQFYESILTGNIPTESCLHESLCDVLLTEITIGNAETITHCLEYLNQSYLATRLQRNPEHYGFSKSAASLGSVTSSIPPQLRILVMQSLSVLSKYDLVNISNGMISATEYGRCYVRHFISIGSAKYFYERFESFENQDAEGAIPELVPHEESTDKSMRAFDPLNLPISFPALLQLVAASPELGEYIVRRTEKKSLKQMSALSKFPIRKGIDVVSKLCILLQAHIGRIPISEPSLKLEATTLIPTAISLLSCLIQFFIDRQWMDAAHVAILLQKSIKQSLWAVPNTLQVLQIPTINEELAKSLAASSYHSLLQLEKVNPKMLNTVLNKSDSFIDNLYSRLSDIPKFCLNVHLSTDFSKLYVSIRPCERSCPGYRRSPELFYFFLFVGYDKQLVSYQTVTINSNAEVSVNTDADIPTDTVGTGSLDIMLLSTTYIGYDIIGSINARDSTFKMLEACSDAQFPRFFDVASKKSKEKKTPTKTVQPTSSTSMDADLTSINGDCSHKCKNKFTCKHGCCKKHSSIRVSPSKVPVFRPLSAVTDVLATENEKYETQHRWELYTPDARPQAPAPVARTEDKPSSNGATSKESTFNDINPLSMLSHNHTALQTDPPQAQSRRISAPSTVSDVPPAKTAAHSHSLLKTQPRLSYLPRNMDISAPMVTRPTIDGSSDVISARTSSPIALTDHRRSSLPNSQLHSLRNVPKSEIKITPGVKIPSLVPATDTQKKNEGKHPETCSNFGAQVRRMAWSAKKAYPEELSTFTPDRLQGSKVAPAAPFRAEQSVPLPIIQPQPIRPKRSREAFMESIYTQHQAELSPPHQGNDFVKLQLPLPSCNANTFEQFMLPPEPKRPKFPVLKRNNLLLPRRFG